MYLIGVAISYSFIVYYMDIQNFIEIFSQMQYEYEKIVIHSDYSYCEHFYENHRKITYFLEKHSVRKDDFKMYLVNSVNDLCYNNFKSYDELKAAPQEMYNQVKAKTNVITDSKKN